LELVNPEALPPAPDGTAAVDDYFEDGITECGPTTLFYSTIYAYNAEGFPGDKPATIEDFFDLAKFPGRRGMRRSPLVNLEFALMADAVPLDEVYATLATDEGMDRAFAKLDTIKEHIVWWEAGAQPPQMLADREVAMSTAYNGRIFNAQIVEQQPFVVVWDGQVLDSGGYGIVAGTGNLAAARALVEYVAKPDSMARLGRYISYSPARRSGTALVSTHLETGIDMAPHMPTTAANMQRALANDWEWWSDHADEVNERFSAWLAR
jgi:putative spermidine/putrescine transport system substrate-binding protein